MCGFEFPMKLARSALLLAGLAGALLLAPPARAQAQALDRAGLVQELCGDAGAMGRAGATLAATAAAGSDEDRAWAAPLARAAIDRKLGCDETGAVLEEGGLDAVTRTPRAATGTPRAPLLSLRNRPVFELGDAAFALRGAPDPARRAAALKTLERRPALIPERLLDRAAEAETDAGLKEQIDTLAQTAALNAADPAARIRAIGRVAEKPQPPRADPHLRARPRSRL
ncbi:hypothetical protein ACFSKM_24985 [Ancylobacter dichloromethanicus]